MGKNLDLIKIKKDVTIIGAGIIGCAISRELSKYNCSVLVIEKENDVSCGTTKANSGIVHAGYAEPQGKLRNSLCVKGNILFRKNAEELDIPIKNTGSLVNVFEGQDISILEELLINGKKNGLSDISLIKDKGKIKKIEPNINSKVFASLYAKDACITSPYEAAFAIYENAKLNGVDYIFNNEVERISIDNKNNNFYLKTPNVIVESRIVINAAGIFADKIASMIGDDSFRITPVKGEYIVFDSNTRGFVNLINFSAPTRSSKGVLVTPTVDENFLIGPNYKETSYYDFSTTIEGMKEIEYKAKLLFPSIPLKEVINSFAGLRAVSDNNDFIISPSYINKNFINVAGIQSPGLTCAFAIAENVIEIIKELNLNLKKNKSFNPLRRSIARFEKVSLIKNKKLIEKDNNYGEIICRCEKVTKAEIIDAIRRGATTLDGVKFRTRAGMGRCQGGYCMLRIMNILSEELKIPVEEIKKSSKNSYLVKEKIL